MVGKISPFPHNIITYMKYAKLIPKSDKVAIPPMIVFYCVSLASILYWNGTPNMSNSLRNFINKIYDKGNT